LITVNFLHNNSTGLTDKDGSSKSRCSLPENLFTDLKSKQTVLSSLDAEAKKNSTDDLKTVESSPEEILGSPLPPQEFSHDEVIMRIAEMGNPEISEDMTIGDHFIAVTPKIEKNSYQASLVVDQFDSTDQWPSKVSIHNLIRYKLICNILNFIN